jgi:2-hydroxychromene-2-carboxylate isomerase
MKILWAFDLISPFAYLSFQQLAGLPPGTEVQCLPVLFAGLLNHHGQAGPAEIASKRRFTYRFVLWRARKMGIPMNMPPAHPFNPLQALRLIIAAGSDLRSVQIGLDYVFGRGRDVSDPTVLADLARELGLPDVRVASSEPAVKQRLRENTDWAIAKGVFGVPTFIVGDELFWGHDAFDMVVDYLRAPALFNDAEMTRIGHLPVGAVRERR